MDLLTHAAAGAALASTLRSRDERGRRVFDDAVMITAVGASLLPDIDVLDTPFEGDVGGLSYMLFHRGHTHTIVGCLVLAMVAVAIGSWLARSADRPRWRLWAAAALGTGLHLLMDATNDYGVHPFWLIGSDDWVYGDFMILSEPLIWAALLPMAIAPFMRDWGQRSVNLLLALLAVAAPIVLVAIAWARAMHAVWMTPLSAALLTAWVAFQFLAYCRWYSRGLGWASVVAVWAVFFATANEARAKARAWLGEHAPGERVVHVVTTPAPANPFCFRIVTASRSDDGSEVATRLGTVSLWPSLVSPSDCFTPNRTAPPNASVTPIEDHSQGWHWVGQFRGAVAQFDTYAEQSCRVKMTRSFIRAPFWVEQDRSRVVVGDLRFDYSRDLGHYCKYLHDPSEPNTPKSAEKGCARQVPWTPPFFTAAAPDAPPAAQPARLASEGGQP